MRMSGRVISLVLAVCLAATSVFAQGTPGSPTTPVTTTAGAALPASPSALPPGFSTKKNFWQKALRFETLSIGAFPIMFFYTNFGFGIGSYIINGFDSRYAPWPFQNQYSILPDSNEKLIRIGVAAGISCAVAVLDIILTNRRDAKAAAQAELDSAIQP